MTEKLGSKLRETGLSLSQQPCQNVTAVGNFAVVSQFIAAYFTLDFTRSPLVAMGTWCLLPTTPAMLSTTTEHFDRAGSGGSSS